MVRVADAGEADLAAAAGIDAVEVMLDDHSPDLAVARAVRIAFPGLLRLRFDGSNPSQALLREAACLAPDEIALPLGAVADLPPGPRTVATITSAGETPEALRRVRHGIGAVMLAPGDRKRIVDEMGIAALDAFASACREAGLAFGLAGGLEAPDVARLLLLGPDVLGFDTAVRRDHAVDGALDPDALAAIRALVPRADKKPSTATSAIAKVTDRIFVRDFEVALAIGAYQAEHGSRQRVRFSVETDVVREPLPPRDMRDVFSYDVIIETIRVLAERAHVTFVETLAEEVAASLLTHPEIIAVTVKVEKLDVVPGAVGIEIKRRRAP